MIKLNKNKKKPPFFSLATIKNLLNTNFLSSAARKTLILVGLSIFFILIASKLINLHIFQHSKKELFLQNTVYKETEEIQQRGFIFDRNKNELAMSIKIYTIYIDAGIMPDLKAVETLLSKYDINLSSEHYKSIAAKKQYIPIKHNVSEQTILQMKKDIKEERDRIKKLRAKLQKDSKLYKNDPEKKEQCMLELEKIKEDKFICVGMSGKYKRVYPEKRLASHVIGKVNAENTGTSGIESTCEQQLNGENIKRQKMVINKYKRIFFKSPFETKAEPSNDIILTIDRKLQFIVEEELEKGLKRTKSKKGVAIIQNPHTGEILAMASLPNYNPEEKVSDQNFLKNNAVGFSAEPGSTFKIVILATVLDKGIFKLTDPVYCENGNFKIFGATIHDHDKQKTITVQQILERSSNVGTSKLALKVDNQTFYRYITNFGFYSRTGIDLTGEEKGILYPVNRWSKISPCSLSFGQELYVTPIQTIGAYSVIANGGTLLKPKIIKAIGDKEYNEPTVVRKNVIKEETAYKVRQALRGVVVDGTGKSARVPGYTVGGKTGTAQKFDQKLKKYSKKNYMASFCGMLPAMNPEIVILVIYDEPNGDEYYASTVAAPVFSKIAQRTAEYLNIPPDIPEELDKSKTKKGAKK
ncbi:MAG: penicillin-binding protein 2 [Endomicrobiaceae bacterium]|nr:penicillin-binding protein 2 [Endomicrobiaceae bacterium]